MQRKPLGNVRNVIAIAFNVKNQSVFNVLTVSIQIRIFYASLVKINFNIVSSVRIRFV